jgi:solute:Na+ symporter, SSS family
MSALDFLVLIGSLVGIAIYGVWRTRGRSELSTYLKGNRKTAWFAIGFSVMATQASAITFLSTPGQGYMGGLGFVQIYFGLPIALIIIAAVFLPVFRRLNIYTACELLGQRFDTKTRLLGAVLFLLQRGLGAGLTIYAPTINSRRRLLYHVMKLFIGVFVIRPSLAEIQSDSPKPGVFLQAGGPWTNAMADHEAWTKRAR